MIEPKTAEERVKMREIERGRWAVRSDGRMIGLPGTKLEIHIRRQQIVKSIDTTVDMCCAEMTKGPIFLVRTHDGEGNVTEREAILLGETQVSIRRELGAKT